MTQHSLCGFSPQPLQQKTVHISLISGKMCPPVSQTYHRPQARIPLYIHHFETSCWLYRLRLCRRYRWKKVTGRICLQSLQRTSLMEVVQAENGITLNHGSRIRCLLRSCSRSPVASQATYGYCWKPRTSSPYLHRLQRRPEKYPSSWVREEQKQAYRRQALSLSRPSRLWKP